MAALTIRGFAVLNGVDASGGDKWFGGVGTVVPAEGDRVLLALDPVTMNDYSAQFELAKSVPGGNFWLHQLQLIDLSTTKLLFIIGQ